MKIYQLLSTMLLLMGFMQTNAMEIQKKKVSFAVKDAAVVDPMPFPQEGESWFLLDDKKISADLQKAVLLKLKINDFCSLMRVSKKVRKWLKKHLANPEFFQMLIKDAIDVKSIERKQLVINLEKMAECRFALPEHLTRQEAMKVKISSLFAYDTSKQASKYWSEVLRVLLLARINHYKVDCGQSEQKRHRGYYDYEFMEVANHKYPFIKSAFLVGMVLVLDLRPSDTLFRLVKNESWESLRSVARKRYG